MTAKWLERLLETVADHGREIIGLGDAHHEQASSALALCEKLVAGQGEASNIAYARALLQRWQNAAEDKRLDFLLMLAQHFNPDPVALQAAIDQYRADDDRALQRLMQAVEPPRQELLRRLNMAPQGDCGVGADARFIAPQVARISGAGASRYRLPTPAIVMVQPWLFATTAD